MLVDRGRQSLVQVHYHTFEIDDPLWKQKNPAADGPAPRVPISALAVDATYGRFWLEPSGPGLPRLCSQPGGSPRTMSLAKAVLQGSENPLLAIESDQDCEEELRERLRKEKGGDGEGTHDDAPGGDSGGSPGDR